VFALPRVPALDQQRAAPRQARQAHLRGQHGQCGLQLGLEQVALQHRWVAAAGQAVQQLAHGVGQLGRQRHLGAGPGRHRAARPGGAAHVGRHLARAHVFEHAAGKHEAVAGAQAGDEALLDGAQAAAGAQPGDRHRGFGHDGADLQPVPERDAAVEHAPAALVQPDAVVVGVGVQAVAAAFAKTHRPVEGVARELRKGACAAHLVVQRVGVEALARLAMAVEVTAQRQADDVLHQHVQRLFGRGARLDPPGDGGVPGGDRLDQLQRIGRHQRDAAGPPRRVAAAAGALQQPRHALGAADLQHALDRQEVHAQVQRGGGDHRLQRARLEPGLDPFAHALVQRAVVQRDQAGPVGPRLQDQLVPDLGLRAHVGEDQRRARAFDLVDHRLQHLRAQVAAPGEAAGVGRQQGVDDEGLVEPALHAHARVGRAGAEQRLQRLLEVAQRGRQPPAHQTRAPAGQPRQRQLHLHAALAADQLVPLVDDHRVHAGQLDGCLRPGQHQAQRLRGRHQHAGQPPVLPCALARGRVAGAQPQRPVRRQRVQRRLQGAHRVGGQGAHRRDPQHLRPAARLPPRQRAQPHGQRLAAAGGRVQQAGTAGGHRRPDLALEGVWRPAAGGEPGVEVGRGGRGRCRGRGRSRGRSRRASRALHRPGPGCAGGPG
jgi:hypothetical protein